MTVIVAFTSTLVSVLPWLSITVAFKTQPEPERDEDEPPGEIDKHATQLDLACHTYEDGVNWPRVNELLKEFLRQPDADFPFTSELLTIATSKPKTDCYIGMLSLGYWGLLYMPPEKRSHVLHSSLFGNASFQEQIPLSYWDSIASGWPVFSLFELVGLQVRTDNQMVTAAECCDHHEPDPQGIELALLHSLESSLSSRELVSPSLILGYMARAPSRCSWGKAAAYFALAERWLLTPGAPRLHLAARDAMQLGEFQLDRCYPGRNVTVVEQMFSNWPIWGFLRRIENHPAAIAALRSQHSRAGALPRMPLGYTPPSPTLLPPGHRGRVMPTSTSPEDAVGKGFDPSHTAASASAAPETVATSTTAAAVASVGAENISQNKSPMLCEARDVHVALSGDRRHAEGVLAALHSIVTTTSSPMRLCVHLFCLHSEVGFYLYALHCSFGSHLWSSKANLMRSGDDAVSSLELENLTLSLVGASLRIHAFEPDELVWTGVDRAFAAGTTLEAGDLNAPHNFVRFHLARWVPPAVAPKLIYLDTDLIVIGDLCKLHDSALLSCRSQRCLREPVVAAVPRRHLPISVYLAALSPRSPRWLPSTAQSFNAGVMVIDMHAWERANITGQVAELVRQNKFGSMWRHGSQPPLLQLLYDRAEWLDGSWNVDGLGHRKDLDEKALIAARILHWTGPMKPWVANGLHQEYWKPFAVHCWGRGEPLPELLQANPRKRRGGET